MSAPVLAHDLNREVLMPRTLPAIYVEDYSVHHWRVNEAGALSLAPGAPPAAAKRAAGELAAGKITMGEFLTRVGVPE